MEPTRRFSNRVADYVKYRPSYPPEVLKDLRAAGILTRTSVIADVGSGTGILARLFLENRHRVFGVEPNLEMRQAGERLLARYRFFTSVEGSAEHTTLPSECIDVVTAGQSFHWFDRRAAEREFVRILRPPGWVVIVWNERKTEASPFLAAYEGLLHQFATDYAAVDHRRLTADDIRGFFAPQPCTLRTYDNRQILDFEGLKGRLLSSSYTPAADHPQHGPMIAALKAVFDAHQVHGHVTIEYQTVVYTGQLLSEPA